MRLFSYRDRPVHLGPYPMERVRRQAEVPDLSFVPEMQALSFEAADPVSLVHAMRRYMGMFDVVRDGVVGPKGEIPDDPQERTWHLKSAGYYFDATMVGVSTVGAHAHLATPIRNPIVEEIARELEGSQPQSFAAGMDMILADVIDSARKPPGPVGAHGHAIVILVEYQREPRPGEPGCDWIVGTQAQRAAVLAAQTAVLLSSYLRMLGHEARAHSATCSELDLGRLAVAAGLVEMASSSGVVTLTNPYLGTRFGLAAVSTTLALATDEPIAPAQRGDRLHTHGPAWWLGKGTLRGTGTLRGALHRDPYARREFRKGAFPFERLRRVDTPTTFIDHDRVPRFPKRADFFARALFGDLGRAVQDEARNAHYVLKSPIGACARRALGALLLLQFGEASGPATSLTDDPLRNADLLKASAYYLGIDAVGLCAVPAWAYYSHDAGGNPMRAYHRNAVNLLVDQGHETMEGASGDDWISVAQSMRAYLRFSLLGGILAEQIRRLGYSARVHSVLDGDVLQPPLLLLSGLGEVSRIGEVILNPYLGPRLKSGTVTTDMPMAPDRPIDFGLQSFCERCNKCARECPAGAITAGPKRMYNGYEIWKSDAEKCARYRITNQGGGMCGRCMKTCPWNLEGLLADQLWRGAAMRWPTRARALASLDDRLGRGAINPVKKWWWDIELDRTDGRYVRAGHVNARGLNRSLVLRAQDQTLAAYPADLMPPPYPVAFPIDREEGIARYRALLAPAEYRRRLSDGRTEGLAPPFRMPAGDPPVIPVVLARRDEMAPDVVRFELRAADGAELPAYSAGAHVDVVIAPEYQRAYSLAGDPADRRRWLLGVQREPAGRGGSALMLRAFRPGRRVFVSRPVNHFPLAEDAESSLLFAGGIGVTPLIAMAHRLHALGRRFALHYSVASRARAAFVAELDAASWRDHVVWHVTDEGTRASFDELVPQFEPGMHAYACGSHDYMQAVMRVAAQRGWPDHACHLEYFKVPEEAGRASLPFRLRLARDGRCLDVPAGVPATDVLARAGIAIDTKCSDGICGVCAVRYVASESDAPDHRDYVLSNAERRERVILCCARTREAGGTLTIDL